MVSLSATPVVPAFDRLARRRKLALALEVMFAYVRVRMLLRRHDLPSTLSTLRAHTIALPGPDTRLEQLVGVRLGRVVVRTLDALPVDSRCLMRSLVLTSLLCRRGIDSSLVIGVTAEPEFGAHAWVETGGRALLPRDETTFERLVRL